MLVRQSTQLQMQARRKERTMSMKHKYMSQMIVRMTVVSVYGLPLHAGVRQQSHSDYQASDDEHSYSRSP